LLPRRSEYHKPTAPQHARNFTNCGFEIGKVMDGLGADDEIETTITKRQFGHVRQLSLHAASGEGT